MFFASIGTVCFLLNFTVATIAMASNNDGLDRRHNNELVIILEDEVSVSKTIKDEVALTGINEIDNLNKQFKTKDLKKSYKSDHPMARNRIVLKFPDEIDINELMDGYKDIDTGGCYV